MLQIIRDHSQGWITGVIIFLVCAAFALWGIHSYVGTNVQPDVIAKINGQKITQTDLTGAYERLRQQQQMQMGADFIVDPKTEIRLKKEALNQLVMEHLLVQAANKNGYRVSMGEVYGALITIPAFQVNGDFSRARFNEVLNSLMYNEDAFLNDMRTTMLTDQVRSGFVDSAFALPTEIDTAVKLVNQKRDLGYAILPASRFMGKVSISDEQAQAYYDQHQAQFTTPEKVSLQYIELSLPQMEANLHFTDPQLLKYYQDNLSNYTHPERWHVAHILVRIPEEATTEQLNAAKQRINELAEQISNGADFSDVASENSDDKLSAKEGGVLDWLNAGMVDPVFEKTIVALKPGQVSAPVRTKYGFDIIKLLAVEPAKVLSFEEVRSTVAKALAQQQAEQVFADASDKLSNLSYANPGALDVAAKALGLPVQVTDVFGHEGGKDSLTMNPKIVAAAFSADVLHGSNSEVIDLDPATAVVVRVHQHIAAALLPFNSVRDSIVQQLKQQASEQQAQTTGQQLLSSMNGTKEPQSIAVKAGLQWHTIVSATRYGASQGPAALINAAFHMPRPAAGAYTTEGFVMPNGDYALIVLNNVHDGVYGKSSQVEQRVYREELENGSGRLDYAMYVRGLLHKSKVVFSDSKGHLSS